MKYLALVAALAVIYAVFARQSQVPAVKEATLPIEAAAAAPAPAPRASDPLKRPIDRTKEVLSQVKTRNGTGEF